MFGFKHTVMALLALKNHHPPLALLVTENTTGLKLGRIKCLEKLSKRKEWQEFPEGKLFSIKHWEKS